MRIIKERKIAFPPFCCAVLHLATQSYPTLCDPMDYSPPGSSVRGDSPSKKMGVGCHALLQGIFPTQGSNPGLPHFRQILYCLSHQGSPCTFVAITKNKGTPWALWEGMLPSALDHWHCRKTTQHIESWVHLTAKEDQLTSGPTQHRKQNSE